MTERGLSVFDKTVQLTNTWLNEIMEELDWADRHRAYLGLRLVLHGIRDHLNVDEAVHLGAQLPMLVRGFYFEGWHPAHKPERNRNVNDFVAHIHDGFRQNPTDEPIDAAEVARAVFQLLSRHISDGEFGQVLHALPKGIRSLGPVEP